VDFRIRTGVALLLVAFGIGPLFAVHAQQAAPQSCQIDEAQRLFGEQPRPDATIEPMLQACVAAGTKDYRTYMFLGVMARDAGDREKAIGYLRKAHEMDPAAPNPALELGFTLEQDHGEEAAVVYGDILKRDPDNRPALLGMGRIDRGQNRLGKARAIYEKLLAANPKDPDALNGLAWLELADRNRVDGRQGFEKVLALDPDNAEAKIGLAKSKDVYRYTFDANGLLVTTATGTAWGFGATALLGFTAFDTLELGETHFGNEIQTLTAVGVATLPSDDIRIGWNRLVPLTYATSLTFDYRGHKSLPTEYWIDGGLTIYLTDYLRWVGGYRQMMGAYQWEGRLFRTGLSASLSPSWDVSWTIYNAAQAIFNNYQYIWSWVADVTYYGPHNLLVVAGFGYSTTINNVDLHARTILPVTDRIALQVAAGYNSLNYDTRVTAGIRFTW
jgi:hypothetical protein